MRMFLSSSWARTWTRVIAARDLALKNWILLENYYLPGDLEHQIKAFVDHYNNRRYHESIKNVTPADAYFGRDTAIIERTAKIKKRTIQTRRFQHQQHAAYHQPMMSKSLC